MVKNLRQVGCTHLTDMKPISLCKPVWLGLVFCNPEERKRTPQIY